MLLCGYSPSPRTSGSGFELCVELSNALPSRLGVSCAGYLVRWCPSYEALENDEVESDVDVDEEAEDSNITSIGTFLPDFLRPISYAEL